MIVGVSEETVVAAREVVKEVQCGVSKYVALESALRVVKVFRWLEGSRIVSRALPPTQTCFG